MEIDLIFKIAAVGIIVSILNQVLVRSGREEQATMTTLAALVVVLVKTLAFGDPVAGWPSMICIILFLGGVQLLTVGIMGQYLAKTYLETKKRPIYILAEKSQDKE